MDDDASGSGTDASAPPRRAPGWGRAAFVRWLPVLLVCLAGLLLMLVLYRAREATIDASRGAALERVTGTTVAVLVQKVDAVLEVLHSMDAFYASSDAVEKDEFESFTASALDRHPAIASIEWIRRVPAADREAFEQSIGGPITAVFDGGDSLEPALAREEGYFPVEFVARQAGSEGEAGAVPGFDYWAHPVLREAMQRALVHPPSASEWTSRLPGVADGSRLVFFFMAVIREAGDPDQRPLDGFVGVTVDVGRLSADVVESVVLLHPSEPVEIRIEDVAVGDLAASGEGDDPIPVQPPAGLGRGVSDSDRIHTRFVRVADREWRVRCRMPDGSGAGDAAGFAGSALVAAALLTLLAARYLYVVLGRAQEVDREVHDRTAALEREIAEREKAESTLKNSEALYHSLVESAPLSVYRKDLKGRIVFGNSSYARDIGRSKDEMIGLTDYDLFPTALAEKYRADDAKVIESGETLEDVEEHKTSDGRATYVHVIKTPTRDASGAIVGSQGMFWDVTARKQAEEKLKATAAELARSNADLEQFAYVASHDLQEPLRMIASYTQLLEKRYGDRLDDDAKEFIRFAVDGANRMQTLIRDLLAYSRVGTRGRPLQAVDADAALDDALANLKVAIEESGTTIERDDLPKVRADPTQLTQLFQNLVGNAIKFRREGVAPVIRVGVNQIHDDSGQWAEIFVADNGIGIEEKFHDRIFMIFQRLHTREEYAGTGIGLAVCKKIVERHGGKIRVASNPGLGTTFFFTLRPDDGESGQAID